MSVESAVGYGRTSPGTDEEEETSLPTQKRSVEKYCEKQGIELHEFFSDPDVSGRKTEPHERDGFSSLVAYIRENNVDAIVVRTKERISRGDLLKSLPEYLEWKLDLDVEVIVVDSAVSEVVDILEERMEEADNPVERRFLERSKTKLEDSNDDIKELEALITAMKTSSALEDKREAGEPTSKPPYALTTDKEKYDKDRATCFVVDDEEKFQRALDIINDFDERDTNPHDDPAAPVGREYGLGDDYSNVTVGVKTIWKNRYLYWTLDEADTEEVKRRTDSEKAQAS